jgi:hypothetical protein
VAEASRATVADACDYFDPDAVWLLATERAPRAHATVRSVTDGPVVHTSLGNGDGPHHERPGDGEAGARVDVVGVRDPAELPGLGRALRDGEVGVAADESDTVFVGCPVTVAVDETRLSATLPAADDLAALVDRAPCRVVVLSDALPADYDHEWRLSDEAERATTVRIHGLGPTEGYGAPSVACLTLSPSGAVGTERVGWDRFGLRALDGVGPRTAGRLRESGVRTREDLRRTPRRQLTDTRGIGSETVERAKRHAEVLDSGDPLRLSTAPLPGERAPAPPLSLDIETDGLSPTIVWQVGVYDPVTDRHRTFTEREDPSDPGRVVERFLVWLFGTHPDRDLLTWNGDRFDYRHLTGFVERYCPEYAGEWDDYRKHDLYDWAVRREHALLPGRTNKLGHVARRLGYDGAGTGLDGAATAAAYERFVRTGEPLDWDRHEAYCEDDCRTLWHVYERLREADRRDGAATGAGTTDSEQAGLGDF